MADATEDLALTLDEVLAEHVYTLKLPSDAPHISLVDGDLMIPDVAADIIDSLRKRGWSIRRISERVATPAYTEPWHGKSTTNG